jgi:hypothetical protein
MRRWRGSDRWQVHEGAADQVCEDLLDNGVVAVRRFGLDHLERGVGEQGVVALGGNSSSRPWAALQLRSLTRRTISRAVIAWPFFEANTVYGTSATSAPEISRFWFRSQIACG